MWPPCSLVTSGFFGVSGNPLYLANLLTYAGLLVIHGNPWVVGLGLGFFLFAYTSIVAAEEAYLRDKFGDAYGAYCRTVNRWWPALGRLPAATSGMRFDWRRVVAKDYSTACSWIGAALLLLGYRTIRKDGFAADPTRLIALAAALALLLTATLVIRLAKKAGWPGANAAA